MEAQRGGDWMGSGERPLTGLAPSILPGTATTPHPFPGSDWRGTASSCGPASPEGPDTEALPVPGPPRVPTVAGPGGEIGGERSGSRTPSLLGSPSSPVGL